MTYTLRQQGNPAPIAGLAPSTPALLSPLNPARLAAWTALLEDGARPGTIPPALLGDRGIYPSPLIAKVSYLTTPDGGASWLAHDDTGSVMRSSRPSPRREPCAIGGAAPEFTHRAAVAFPRSTLEASYVGQHVFVELASGRWFRCVVASDGASVLLPAVAAVTLPADTPAAVVRESIEGVMAEETLFAWSATGEGGAVLARRNVNAPAAVTWAPSTLGAIATSRAIGGGLVAVRSSASSNGPQPWLLVAW